MISKTLAFFTGALALSALGCNQAAEGDRCNAALSHDECGSGLACTQPASCPETYCCPVNASPTSAYCKQGCAGGDESICAATGTCDAGADVTAD